MKIKDFVFMKGRKRNYIEMFIARYESYVRFHSGCLITNKKPPFVFL